MNTSGIGLGLHICKTLCESFDGNITVNSVKGLGSIFTFTFKTGEAPHLNHTYCKLTSARDDDHTHRSLLRESDSSYLHSAC